MKPIRAWQGVRMRRLSIGSDPDAPPRLLSFPASWDDAAGAALATLAPGDAGASLAVVAEAWIRPLNERARNDGLEPAGDSLHALLRRRQGAPSAGIWHGQPEDRPGFVLNLAAFHDATAGFDVACYEAAIDTAVIALTMAAPAASEIAVSLADLAGLLACLGLDYDSSAARDLASCLAALLRARADAASARLAGLFGAMPADAVAAAAPPPRCIIPGLAAAAGLAWAERPRGGLRHAATTAIAPPGAVDALLGVETGGIAPAFSPLTCAGALTRTARADLAARGLSAEVALADLMAGIDHLPPVPASAHLAMRAAVSPYVTLLPPLATACPVASSRRELPARSRGYAQRATVGGHTLFLRTGEYEDGTLGEIAITAQKESAAFRGLMDCFAQAVSIGLQHGVALADYVEAFSLTRFGAAGVVEGDPAVTRATSLLDYVFRNLAVHYLNRRDDPPALDEVTEPRPALPLLPMDLPQDNRPRGARLRLVGK
jgi:ribonucleoside-diphosphate reductase alpha chain